VDDGGAARRELMSADDFRALTSAVGEPPNAIASGSGTVSRPVFVGEFADAVDRDRDLVDRLLH